MSLDNSNTNNFLEQLIIINNFVTKNLFLNEMNVLLNQNSNILFPLIFTQDSIPIPNKGVLYVKENKERKSESTSTSESPNLLNNIENNSVLEKEEPNLNNGKRYRARRPRKENQDNIRRKIKRAFLNYALLKKLNDKLRSIGSKKYFERFPQYFVTDVNKRRNKEILDMTLQEIFEKKELYIHENDEKLFNYLHNLNVVQSVEIKENEEFKTILNKTFRDLYEEYINSNDFNDEINRLKNKNEHDEYIARYIYLAKHLNEFFSK